MADAAVEQSPEQVPAQEVIDESIAKRKQSISSVDSHQNKDGHREAPVSPRRNGLPPKRTTATTKRPLNAPPVPASKPTASSTSRTAPGNGLSKPPTRPATGTVPRRPAQAVNAATAASTGHKSRPSTSSIEDKPKPRSDSTDKTKKPVTNGTAKRVSIAPNTSVRAPVSKSGAPPTTARVSIGPSTTSERKPTTSRSTASVPTTPTAKPSTNSTARSTTSSNTARTARPIVSSKPTGKDGPVAEAAKKRLSAIHPSPAPIQKPSSDSASSGARRPGLPTRQSTLSVTIQQRLREMHMVHQMLSAAMAEDDSGNDEDKQEAARQADEGIAMLKAKLEKAKAEEAANGQGASDGEVGQETDLNEHKTPGAESPETHDKGKEHQDGDVAQLKDRLEKREATISALEADLQAELLESSRVRHSTSKQIEEATESLRQEHRSELDGLYHKHEVELDAFRTELKETQANNQDHKSELDDLNHKHQAELVTLRTKLEEMQANHEEHKSELDDLNHRHQVELDTLHAQLKETQANHQECQSEIGDLNHKHQAELDALHTKLKETQANHQEKRLEVDDLNRKHQAELEALRTKLEEMQAHHEEHKSELDDLNHKHHAELDTLRTKLEASQANHREQQAEIDDLNRKHQAELEALRTKLEELQVKHGDQQSELDDLDSTHRAELDALRTELEETQAKHRELAEEGTKDLEEAVKLAREEAQNEAAKNSEQVESTHTKMLKAIEERLAYEQEQSSGARAKVEELTAMLAEVEKKVGEAEADRSRLEIEHADVLTKRDRELDGKDQVIDDLKAELQRLHESREEELEAAKETAKYSESELKEENSKLKAELKKEISRFESELEAARSISEGNTNAHEKAMKAKDKELDNMSEKLRESEHVNADHTEEVNHRKDKMEALERQLEEMRNSTSAAAKAAEEEAAAVARSLKETLKAAEAEAQENKKLSGDSQQALKGATDEIEALKEKLEAAEAEVQEDKKLSEDSKQAMKGATDEIEALKDKLKAAETGAQENKKLSEDSKQAMKGATDEIEALKEKLKAAEAEAQENKKLSEDGKGALDGAMDEIKGLKKALETFCEEHQGKDEQYAASLKTLKSEVDAASKSLEQSTQELQSAIEKHNKEMQDLRDQHAAEKKAIEASADSRYHTSLDEARSAAEAADKENDSLQEQLRKAEDTAERHALKLRELEAAYKVTSAELTEMQTKRTNGADFCASPTPKSGLPLSKWADLPEPEDTDADGKEGEELGSSIEGTMAGLQEQVRQLEEVNEDMLEETTRIVKMLSDVPEGRTSRGKSSEEES